MTPEQAKTLKWFKWSEFDHPEKMDYAFVKYVDDVREEYGFPLVVSSDYRTAAHNKRVGGVSTSRHLFGQAMDFMAPPDAAHLWLLVVAVVKAQRAFPVEFEVVPLQDNRHVHIAWLPTGKASKFLIPGPPLT